MLCSPSDRGGERTTFGWWFPVFPRLPSGRWEACQPDRRSPRYARVAPSAVYRGMHGVARGAPCVTFPQRRALTDRGIGRSPYWVGRAKTLPRRQAGPRCCQTRRRSRVTFPPCSTLTGEGDGRSPRLGAGLAAPPPSCARPARVVTPRATLSCVVPAADELGPEPGPVRRGRR